MGDDVPAPLAGVRVVDAATLYAGPLIATFLADQGAEVVKVEPPGGDPYRSWPPMWALVGRRKRSLTLDLRSEQGRDVFRRLAARVDVVVENLPHRLAAERRLTPADLRAVKPSLVVVSASGFGPDGPYAGHAANGTVAEAFSGLTGLTGEPDGPPQLPSAPLGDAVAAAFGAMGALAGVVRALRTGEGATVDLTVHEPLLHALGVTLAGWRPGAPPPQRDGGAMGVPLRGTFRAADGGWVAISASNPRQEQTVAELAGGDAAEPLRDRVAAWIASAARADVLAALAAARISAGQVHDLAEMAAHPQVEFRGTLQDLAGATIVRPTPAIDGAAVPATLPPLGDATDEVLCGWAGLTRRDLATLRAAGIV